MGKSEKQSRIDRKKEFQAAERKEQYALKERRVKRDWERDELNPRSKRSSSGDRY